MKSLEEDREETDWKYGVLFCSKVKKLVEVLSVY